MTQFARRSCYLDERSQSIASRGLRSLKRQNMNTTKISLFAGAAVIVAGGLVWGLRMNPSASTSDGQGTIGAPESYKAEISMAFRAGTAQMTPGTYDFKVTRGTGGGSSVLVRKSDGTASAILLPAPGSDAPKAWRQEGNPKISFNCVDNACTLAKLWNGRDVSTFEFSGAKPTGAEKERLAEVSVGLTRAD
jgi:hypothetical protein